MSTVSDVYVAHSLVLVRRNWKQKPLMVMKMIRDKDFLNEKLKAGIFESMIFGDD